MSKRDYLYRELLIIRRLQKGEATFEQIQTYLRDQSQISGENLEIEIRTFQREREDILSLYGISIEYDFRRKVYYIDEDSATDFNLRMLESFEIANAFNLSDKLSRYIHVQRTVPKGMEHFPILFKAIKRRHVVRITYCKFINEVFDDYVVEPYAFKEFEGRWYVIARNPSEDYMTIFGLDRIDQIEVMETKFKVPIPAWDVNMYFKDCYGIFRPNASEPPTIELSFSPEQGKYIKSLPLHESQHVKADNKEEVRVVLYLYPTFDLIQKLLSYADDVKVISPASLKKEIRRRLLNALKQYEKP